jgi:CCR4-NOT complex subunit CAF16
LDVLARKDLLDYLKHETVERDCTIVYCTHIFDGMDDWPTQSLFMSAGRIRKVLDHPLPQSLYRTCLDFMVEAREEAHQAKKQKDEPFVEEFGVQGFGAGRMFPTTDFFSRNRMNDYKF